MKKIYLILISFIALQVQAQTQNASFENWGILHNTFTVTVSGFYVCGDFDYNELNNWSSTNQLTGAADFGAIEVVSQSMPGQTGASAVRLETQDMSISPRSGSCSGPVLTTLDNSGPGLIVSGSFTIDIQQLADELVSGSSLQSLNPFTYEGTGQPIDFRPGTLHGMYKYAGVGGDSALVVTGAIKNRQMVAYAITRLPNAGSWTAFDLDFEYLTCETPDTIVTLFCSSNLDATFTNGVFSVNSNNTGVTGSVLYLDEISLDTLDASAFPPEAMDDNSTITNIETAVLDVVTNDVNCDPSGAAPVIVNAGQNGTATNGTGNELEYTPNSGYSGTDMVTYYICNAGGVCDTATWTITINPVPECVAVDDYRSVISGNSSVFDPLQNDTDCGGVPQILVNPTNGNASINSGLLAYSPLSGFSGSDSLTYVVCSSLNTSQCDTAKVYYDVATSIIDLSVQGVSVSPNPTRDYVNIKIDLQNAGLTKVSVYNLLGKVVYETSFLSFTQINMKDFPNGVYLLNFENKLGKGTQKLILAK